VSTRPRAALKGCATVILKPLDPDARHDPAGPSAVAAWRDAMAPGIDYLKSKAGKAAYAGA
jgi:hypothetical protein